MYFEEDGRAGVVNVSIDKSDTLVKDVSCVEAFRP
jgi:hypothetical protein